MTNRNKIILDSTWSNTEKAVFRFFALYFFIQVLPLDARFFKNLGTINWFSISYRDIFYLSRYSPSFAGADTFLNWLIVAALAGIGAVIWSLRDTSKTDYDRLYYWVRVLVRYRLAIGVIAYGFIKLFPLQAPLPSISNLNTNYGDFTAWKLFSLGLGVVPNSQSFLGLVEIIGGLLLLNRKTTTIGTLIIIPFTGNVFVSNIAYEGGEYVYSFYLITLALFLFAYDGLRLFNLFSLEQATAPAHFKPVFSEKGQKARLALKTAFIFFFVALYGYKTYAGYRQGPYQFPQKAGLPKTEGLYNVSEFKLNDTILPYSKTDANRWQDVVFEKWNTVSIKSNRPVILEVTTTEEIHRNDEDRDYEYAGSQGRHYYSYEVDTKKQVLHLKNRNKNHANETLTLHFSQPNDSTIVLKGVNERQDSLTAVLKKINKKYLMFEAQKTGRRRGLKL
ncbi:DoxX family protein [Runella sp. CRIBMP]|uniref:DoxX family protein n=1 Tax=Runella sp. CRIBMP TaxID=2683261 RepID=UPI0014122960|nr:DoxX family protein [Runella sp. CRIBMP]NBB23004.1 DoxX family protein [Runella sp. CRIBMP]